MKSKSIALIMLIIVAVTVSNCKKKISKYPFDMTGVWYAENSFWTGTVLVIENSGEGKLFSFTPSGSMSTIVDVNEKGTVKYRKDLLYIGRKKFTIFNEPVEVTAKDSIEAPNENDFTSEDLKKRKVLARMTLKSDGGIASFPDTYTLSKYVDY